MNIWNGTWSSIAIQLLYNVNNQSEKVEENPVFIMVSSSI